MIGLVGAGNMAPALARGWGEPVLCTDSGSGRAQALAAELGGEAVGSNAELAERADVVVLAHKPAQLEAVAAEIAGQRSASSRCSPARRRPSVRAAYPGTPVVRVEPNTPVGARARRARVRARRADDDARAQVEELFAPLGTVVASPSA